ncbi:hypothetical protein TNCV_3052281 [Trichonephila clavipes]|nr:hypothetical protein TNCV_3052281 [Trichonephila clavipes]
MGNLPSLASGEKANGSSDFPPSFPDLRHGDEIASGNKRELEVPRDLRRFCEKGGRWPRENLIRGMKWDILLPRTKGVYVLETLSGYPCYS